MSHYDIVTKLLNIVARIGDVVAKVLDVGVNVKYCTLHVLAPKPFEVVGGRTIYLRARPMTIASFIKQDLIANISAGQLPADRLTLDSLSKRYRVSITPVRAAIRELIAERYLKKGGNGRLAVQFSTPTTSPAAPEEPIDWGRVIANDLVQLSLEGAPILLREEATAAKYGVSRPSIRHIFHRLSGRGILEHLPRRGWRLRPFRQADLDAYIDMRAMLEVKALQLAWPRLVDEELIAMLDGNCLSERPDDCPKCDNSLHAYLIEKAKNPYIAEFFDRHGDYYNALFEWESLDHEAQVQEVRQHREILEAMIRRDRSAAEQALANHIRTNHPLLSASARSSPAMNDPRSNTLSRQSMSDYPT